MNWTLILVVTLLALPLLYVGVTMLRKDQDGAGMNIHTGINTKKSLLYPEHVNTLARAIDEKIYMDKHSCGTCH
jgi:hypothetical protein